MDAGFYRNLFGRAQVVGVCGLHSWCHRLGSMYIIATIFNLKNNVDRICFGLLGAPGIGVPSLDLLLLD